MTISVEYVGISCLHTSRVLLFNAKKFSIFWLSIIILFKFMVFEDFMVLEEQHARVSNTHEESIAYRADNLSVGFHSNLSDRLCDIYNLVDIKSVTAS